MRLPCGSMKRSPLTTAKTKVPQKKALALNERKTEDLVEQALRAKGYYNGHSDITVEKQRSDTPRVQKLLEKASKQGFGVGRPEFLIRSARHPDFIIVIECKADTQKHASASRDKYAEYAVDGALLYASFLSRDFDVLAIAVSGQDSSILRVSHFFHLKGSNKAIDWPAAQEIVTFDDYYQAFISSDAKFRQDYDALIDYSRGLNNQLQAKKITEADRGFLVSGVLIALQNRAFKQSFKLHSTAKQLATSLLKTINAEFEGAELPQDRREDLAQSFSFIAHCAALVSDLDFFVSLIDGIDENINTFRRTHEYYDIIGQFYVEFLRYANNDKGLGIVLTPPHIAELFAELADVNKNSIVFDNCCGTSGLLIAAMEKMISHAGPDKELQKKIKKSQLYGIEYQSKIYALAVSNMVLHGDGKTNIYRGNCFEDAAKVLARHKPTIGVLNPPYKNKTVRDDKEELEFVFNNLNSLDKGGKCVAIVPITCATAPDGIIADWKKTLLEKHTLEAVLSMPIELFHNSKTTVVTCVMIFTAHRSHQKGKKTWFGYCRNDGFVKTKHRGRIDLDHRWPGIKKKWVDAYVNREVIKGFSVMREVTFTDEWCAEAYLETDYNAIDEATLTEAVKRHIIGRIASTRAAFEDDNE